MRTQEDNTHTKTPMGRIGHLWAPGNADFHSIPCFLRENWLTAAKATPTVGNNRERKRAAPTSGSVREPAQLSAKGEPSRRRHGRRRLSLDGRALHMRVGMASHRQ